MAHEDDERRERMTLVWLCTALLGAAALVCAAIWLLV